MFTWLFDWFPAFHFSTFILVNAVVVLINASTILVLKYRSSHVGKSKERAADKRKSRWKTKKNQPNSRRRSPSRSKTADQSQKTIDERGRCRTGRSERDESYDTTLDEITWLSSNADEADVPYREGRVYGGGQRQHKFSQQRSRKAQTDKPNANSSRKASPSDFISPMGEECESSGFKKAIEQINGKLNPPLYSTPVDPSPERAQNKSLETFEGGIWPLKKSPIQTDVTDGPVHSSKWIRIQLDHFDKSNVSPKEKPPTPKSTQSSGWSSNWSITKCDLCAADHQSFSCDCQVGSNKSEVSTHLNRDSWIWFSNQCPTNAGNFAARQDTFRSTDPRVPELLAKITRQDQMNEDIQREANSLIASDFSKMAANEPQESYETRLPGCPIMRRNGLMYNDKTLHGDNMPDCTKDKDSFQEKSPLPPSNYDVIVNRSSSPKSCTNLTPSNRSRIKFVSPRARRESLKQAEEHDFAVKSRSRSFKTKYKHSPQTAHSCANANKNSPGYDRHSLVDVASTGDGAICNKKSKHCIQASVACVFQTDKSLDSLKQLVSPKRHEIEDKSSGIYPSEICHSSIPNSYENCYEENETLQIKKDVPTISKSIHERSVPPAESLPTVQYRDDSESDSIIFMSTSVDTNGDKTNQIGQEVSRTIKNIIFNNDSFSSTSNSKLGSLQSSLHSKTQPKTTEEQITPISSNREVKKITQTSSPSPRMKVSKVDRRPLMAAKESPPSKPRRYSSINMGHRKPSPSPKDKQLHKKYVFSSSYYLSKQSQSQLKLCSSRSYISGESCKSEPKLISASANPVISAPTDRDRIVQTTTTSFNH